MLGTEYWVMTRDGQRVEVFGILDAALMYAKGHEDSGFMVVEVKEMREGGKVAGTRAVG